MPFSTVLFSADETRGALLGKVLGKKGFEVFLQRNLLALSDILNTKSPQVVILDKEGYFPGELEAFSSLRGLLREVPVVVVANTPADTSLLPGISVAWCQSDPLDPLVIAVKALSLLKAPVKNDSAEKETLAEDLRDFLGIK